MQLSSATITSFLVFYSTCVYKSDAFSALTPLSTAKQQRFTSSTRLNVFFPRMGDDSEEGGEEPFDVEAARQKLEALAGGGEPYWELAMRTVPSSTTNMRSPSYQEVSQLPSLDDVTLPPAPPLTTIERERRQAEIQFMGKLADGDEAGEDLFTLWFNEKGPTAANTLRKAEALTNEGPEHWEEAEDLLKELIDEHGVYFAEPLNRLATLYYMQGKLEKAETLCKMVLRVKPWHFGALSGIVMIYAALADSNKARMWAASRLPTYAPDGINRRRHAWVQMAVQSATDALALAEDRVHELFGAPDDYIKRRSMFDSDTIDDTDAWQ